MQILYTEIRNARLIYPIFSRVLLCTHAAAQAKVLRSTRTEAKFLDVFKTLVFLLAIRSHLYTNEFTPPPRPIEQWWFETGL